MVSFAPVMIANILVVGYNINVPNLSLLESKFLEPQNFPFCQKPLLPQQGLLAFI